MIDSVSTYNEARQAAFRHRVLEARLRKSNSATESRRLREALNTRVPLVDVLLPSMTFAW